MSTEKSDLLVVVRRRSDAYHARVVGPTTAKASSTSDAVYAAAGAAAKVFDCRTSDVFLKEHRDPRFGNAEHDVFLVALEPRGSGWATAWEHVQAKLHCRGVH